MTAYTQRVKIGAFYTDGARLAEVTKVYELGYVMMTDCSTGEHIGRGISAFRREWWLVSEPREQEAA